MIVIDAVVVVAALIDGGEDGERVRVRIRGERLTSPEVMLLEVTSALRNLERAGSLTPRQASQAVHDLEDLSVRRAPHRPLLRRCWELRHNLTPYDAAYVALAEASGAVLLTGDRRMAGASGPRCAIETV